LLVLEGKVLTGKASFTFNKVRKAMTIIWKAILFSLPAWLVCTTCWLRG